MKKVLIGLAAVMLPLMVFAQPPLPQGPQTYGAVITIINTVGQWLFGILLALAVIFLVYAAFLYLTAAGDDKKIDQAKKIILYAVIAIIVAVLARGIVAVVQSLVVGQVTTP